MADKTNKPSKNDYLHSIVKGGLSEIPILGGVISEFFGLAVLSPLQKRQDEWLNSLYKEINILKEEKKEFEIENLQKNENFISIVTQTSQFAVKNHKEEKLEYLKNITINSVTSDIEFEDQVQYLNYIENFNSLHIKLLKLVEKNGVNGLQSRTDELSGIQLISYLSITNKQEFRANIALQDIDIKGLIDKKYSNHFNSKNSTLTIFLSEVGKDFLKYITK